MRNYLYSDKRKNPTSGSAINACAAILLGIFSFCISVSAQAYDQQEAAVATADATVDDVVNNAINNKGIVDSRSVTEADGNIVLQGTEPAVHIAKAPEKKQLQKKSELAKSSTATNVLQLSTTAEIK